MALGIPPARATQNDLWPGISSMVGGRSGSARAADFRELAGKSGWR